MSATRKALRNAALSAGNNGSDTVSRSEFLSLKNDIASLVAALRPSSVKDAIDDDDDVTNNVTDDDETGDIDTSSPHFIAFVESIPCPTWEKGKVWNVLDHNERYQSFVDKGNEESLLADYVAAMEALAKPHPLTPAADKPLLNDDQREREEQRRQSAIQRWGVKAADRDPTVADWSGSLPVIGGTPRLANTPACDQTKRKVEVKERQRDGSFKTVAKPCYLEDLTTNVIGSMLEQRIALDGQPAELAAKRGAAPIRFATLNADGTIDQVVGEFCLRPGKSGTIQLVGDLSVKIELEDETGSGRIEFSPGARVYLLADTYVRTGIKDKPKTAKAKRS